MKVRLEKSFPMPGSAEAAWAVLSDIERVAACMPGAKIAETVDASHYKGTVAVRFGPAQMNFRGEVEVLELDAAQRRIRLSGKGTDAGGGSGAAMDLSARIEAGDTASCTLAGDSEVSMSGKAASFGSRLAVPVAEQVLAQFAANFAAQVQAEQAARSAGTPPGASMGTLGEPGAPSPNSTVAVAAAPPAAAAQINGFAFLWAVLIRWLRGLWGSRT